MINTEEEYNRALLDVEYFFDNQHNLTSEEIILFNTLVDDIIKYEEKTLGIDLMIIDDNNITLSSEETKRFIENLDKPFEPNERLKKAMDKASGISRNKQ